jgi:hypothetical protein
VGQGEKRQLGRALAQVVPKRDLARAEVTTARVSVASPPRTDRQLPEGRYALALVDAVLYLARIDAGPPAHVRLRLAEAQLAMAFGGPPYHSTLHLEHPAVGRLVVSLPAIEFAALTEARVDQVRVGGGW